jgi:hypothetical protein
VTENTKEWDLYQKGLDFYRKLNLFAEVDQCERFYAGDHWNGVKSNGLPTPVLNILARVIDYKVSQIMSNSLKIQYSIQGIDETVQEPTLDPNQPLDPIQLVQYQQQLAKYQQTQQYEQTADTFNGYAETTWERLKMDSLLEQVLKDAAVTGDGYIYFPWDSSIKAKGVFADSPPQGDFTAEVLDNVNVILGNPNDSRINYCGKPVQPYIVIPYRGLVEDFREEARANGIPEDEVQRITGDQEYQNQSGDKAKIELDGSGKTIALLYLRYDRKAGTIMAKKSTRYARISDEYDSKRKLYPVVGMNWKPRKNCCHGESEAKAVIPNQLQVNKLLAMLIMSVMRTAYPKMIYDKTRIEKPSNAIGEAIGIDGGTDNVRNLISYIDGANSSPESYKLLDSIITYTKEMMGANDAALGEVNPDNTSAFIAVNQASAVPLLPIQKRFYQFVEDIAHIWLDYWLTNYTVPRELSLKNANGMVSTTTAILSDYKDLMFNIKVDVGPSNQWSEIVSIQELQNLLNNNQINIVQYLDRIPKGFIPKTKELIDEKKAEIQQQQQMQMLAQTIQSQIPQKPAS